MCKVTRNPCRIVELEHRGGWPDFMRCDDTEKFPPGCKVSIAKKHCFFYQQIDFQNLNNYLLRTERWT